MIFQEMGGGKSNLKPHIVVNFMESFGFNILEIAKEHNLDLLFALNKHFESDFLWRRFLSADNGTLGSLSDFLFASQVALSNSVYKKTNIEMPFTPFVENGYEVIFVTSGNRSWNGIGDYMRVLGVKVIDANDLIGEFEGAGETNTGYGIADEFAYKKILQILSNAKQPKLIIHLTISNHPPYKPPKLLLDKIPEEFLGQLKTIRHYDADSTIQSFAYAANAFGEFMDTIKSNKNLSKNTIVAMSGDHKQREIMLDSNKRALNYSVPFYLFVPKNLQNNIHFDKNRIGSHKDIFPTLIGLALPRTKFISLGGRDLLDFIKDERLEFGINGDVLITDSFVLQGESMYEFFPKDSMYDTNNPLEINEYYKDFRKKYNDLRFYFLQERLNASADS